MNVGRAWPMRLDDDEEKKNFGKVWEGHWWVCRIIGNSLKTMVDVAKYHKKHDRNGSSCHRELVAASLYTLSSSIGSVLASGFDYR